MGVDSPLQAGTARTAAVGSASSADVVVVFAAVLEAPAGRALTNSAMKGFDLQQRLPTGSVGKIVGLKKIGFYY